MRKALCICLLSMACLLGNWAEAAEYVTASLSVKEYTNGKLKIVTPVFTISNRTLVAKRINEFFDIEAKKVIEHYLSERSQGIVKTSEFRYAVMMNNYDLLSVMSHYYDYYDKAAHPLSGKSGVTFDTITGRKIPWQALVKEEDRRAFSLAAINEKIFASDYAKGKRLYQDFKGLKKLPKNYYVDAEGKIHFVFGQYEIAPYASGIIDIDMGKYCKQIPPAVPVSVIVPAVEPAAAPSDDTNTQQTPSEMTADEADAEQ